MLTSPGPPGPPGPPASLPPPRRFGRRLNRIPAIIAIGIVGIVIAAACYTVYEHGQDALRRRLLSQPAPSGADASSTLKDMPTGWIPPNVTKTEPVKLTLPPAVRADQSTPGPKPPELPDDNGREKQRQAAWVTYWNERKELHDGRFKQRHEAMLALKTSVEAGGHSVAETPEAPAAPASSQQSTAPSYAGTQNAWGGGGGSPSMAGLWGGGGFGGYGLSTPQIDREGQEQKIGFARQQGDLGKNDVVPTVRKPPDPYAVMAGSFVKFTTMTETNSDVPGSQIGRVSESVYNNDGTCILIPQFTKLIGHYNSVVSTGQSRLPGVLTRLIFPDGSSQAIGAMESADNAGSAGQEDQINRHLIQKFGSALIASAFGAAIQLSVPHNAINGYDSTQIIAASVGQQMGQLGQQIALQNLSIPNTITIRAGYNGTMITDKDLHITPWSCGGSQHRAAMLPIMQMSGQ